MQKNNSLLVAYISLFSSFSTLICCALPSLMVAIGLGASFAGLIGSFPQLIWFSQHKTLVFSLSAIFIMLGGALLYQQRNAPCPIDPEQATACKRARHWSVLIWMGSVFCWMLGAFFAFAAPFLF